MHFSRDNPNVPSDLEQMPHLLNFLEQNGTVFSNSPTPMVAHNPDDSLVIYTVSAATATAAAVEPRSRPTTGTVRFDPATSFTY